MSCLQVKQAGRIWSNKCPISRKHPQDQKHVQISLDRLRAHSPRVVVLCPHNSGAKLTYSMAQGAQTDTRLTGP